MKVFLIQQWQKLQKTSLIPILLIFLAAIAVYANSINGDFFWDDTSGIVDNVYVHEPGSYFLNFFSESLFAGAKQFGFYWRPMVLTVFSIEWHLWFLWAPGYHAVNIFFHALSGILVFFLFKKIFARKTLALLSALVFITHPLQTEAIAYISGLADPLGSVFMLLAVLTYLKSEENEDERRLYRLLSYLLIIFALFTKESSIILPALMFLCDLFMRPMEKFSAKELLARIKMIAPFFGIVMLYIAARVSLLNFIPSSGTAFTWLSLHERIFTFFHVFVSYISLIFMPVHLHMERILRAEHSLFEPVVLLGGFLILFLIVLFFTEFKRRPIVSFSIAWFFIILAPNSSIFMPTTALLSEHWLYLGLPAFFFALFFLLDEFFRKNGVGYVVTIPLLLITFGTFGMLSFERNKDWSDALTIFTATVRESPRSERAHLNLSREYFIRKEYEKAREHLQLSIEINPSSSAYYALALIDAHYDNKEEEIKNMERSVSLDPVGSPAFSYFFNTYLKEREYEKARALLEERLKKTVGGSERKKVLLVLSGVAIEEGNRALAQEYLKKIDIEEKEISSSSLFSKGSNSFFEALEKFGLLKKTKPSHSEYGGI